jgi:hypothetical protein
VPTPQITVQLPPNTADISICRHVPDHFYEDDGGGKKHSLKPVASNIDKELWSADGNRMKVGSFRKLMQRFGARVDGENGIFRSRTSAADDKLYVAVSKQL